MHYPWDCGKSLFYWGSSKEAPEILFFVLPCTVWHTLVCVHDAKRTLSLAAGSQPRAGCYTMVCLTGIQSRVLSGLPLSPVPFSPCWLPNSSVLIMHTSLRVLMVSGYQLSNAACLGSMPGNGNPNHNVRGFILLPWIHYTTLWQRQHSEKNRLCTWIWTCHKIHFSFQLKLLLQKRSCYHVVCQHKAL